MSVYKQLAYIEDQIHEVVSILKSIDRKCPNSQCFCTGKCTESGNPTVPSATAEGNTEQQSR